MNSHKSAVVIAGALIGLLATTMSGMPASAAALPKLGDTCSSKELWSEIPVKKTSKGNVGPYTFTRVKASEKADRFVCIPKDWVPEFGPSWAEGLGTWQWDRRQVRLIFDPELYQPDPKHEPCNLKSFFETAERPGELFERPAERAWGLYRFERQPARLLPSTGSVKGLVLPLAPADLMDDLQGPFGEAMVRNFTETLTAMYPRVEDFLWNQSRGRLDISYDVHPKLLTVPRNLPSLRPITDQDQVNLLQSLESSENLDLSGYDFVVFNYAFDVARASDLSLEDKRAFASPQRDYSGVSGEFTNSFTMFMAINTNINLSSGGSSSTVGGLVGIAAHETLHLMGLPDLYSETATIENGRLNRWAGNMSVMDSHLFRGLTGYERWILGWLPTRNVECVSAEEPNRINGIVMSSVDSLDQMGTKLIMIHAGPKAGIGDQLQAIELRSNDGTTSGFGGLSGQPGLLTYEVRASSYSARKAGMADQLYQDQFAPLTVWRRDTSTLRAESEFPQPESTSGPEFAAWEEWNRNSNSVEEDLLRDGDHRGLIGFVRYDILDVDITHNRDGARATVDLNLR